MSDAAQRAKAALEAGDLAAMTRLIEAHPELLTASAWEGRGLVALAADVLTTQRSIPLICGSPDQDAVLEFLLARGADPNRGDPRGWTALHAACMSGHVELARSLLENGASLRAVVDGNAGATPIAWALFYAHRETAELLAVREIVPGGLRSSAALGLSLSEWLDDRGELRPGATRDRSFYRPLEQFPEWDLPLDRQTTLDEALSWASRNGRVATLAELVELGAEPNSNAYRGTPLLWATYAGSLEAMRWLVAHGADPNLAHDFGGAGHGLGATALHLAAQFGALDAIELLLELGADPSVRDRAHGGSPAEWAAHCGQTEAAELLGGLEGSA